MSRHPPEELRRAGLPTLPLIATIHQLDEHGLNEAKFVGVTSSLKEHFAKPFDPGRMD